MNEDEIVKILKKVGAVITDSHIVYTSGKHGSVYVNKDAIYPHTEYASRIGQLFCDQIKDLEIDVVVGPALGGIILSQWTAYHLTMLKGKEVFGVYVEKQPDGSLGFNRGYDSFVRGKKVLVVEDITNTGGSVKKTIEAVKAIGGEVVAVTVIANRSPKIVTSDFLTAPFYALCVFEAQAFEEANCPLCKAGVPINTSVGHGKKYLEQKKSL